MQKTMKFWNDYKHPEVKTRVLLQTPERNESMSWSVINNTSILETDLYKKFSSYPTKTTQLLLVREIITIYSDNSMKPSVRADITYSKHSTLEN